MKQRVKIAVVVVLAAGLAAGGAAWKWRAPTIKIKSSPSYQIAGWSWGDHSHPNSHGNGVGNVGGVGA
jgi:type IV secretory pathway protease TraF